MNIYVGGPIVVNDMQGPCPDGFHVPLSSERQALYNAFTGLGLSNSNHLLTYLKLPMASYRNNTKSVSSGGYGAYWSSSINGDGSNIFYFGSVSPQIRVFDRCYGLNIRPFKDTPKVPTDSWTKLYGTSIESGGIFHNSTDGLISISSDGSTWYTIMDKNLGATEVCEYSSPLSDANCGNVFQRGNNYPFPGTYSSDSITSLTTQVDASIYGPGNYYESNTYITRYGSPRGWDSSNNANLRGGVSQGTSTKSVEAKNIYIGEYKPPRTFTISWTETSNPASFNPIYSDDAAGLTAGSSDFDDFFGYYGCRLSNAGVETATVSQSSPGILDITQLGTLTSGDNVMIAFPRRGIKMSKSGTTVTLSITEEPNKSGYQYYAHTKGSADKDTLYLGAYKMASGYTSLSGKSPLVNLTRDGFRQGIKTTYDSSAGINRYSQISIYARWYINALYMMKYGNPDSQTVIGQGYTGSSGARSTGNTNSQTSASYGTTSTTQQVKLFGLEDWWGNVTEVMDCCWFNSNTQLTVDKTNSILQDSDYSTNLGTSSDGWMAGIDGSNDGMFMNISTSGGSGTTYYTDYSSASASRALRAGGNFQGSTATGAFQYEQFDASRTFGDSGSRLMYL